MFAAWLQGQWFAQRRLSPALWLLLPLFLPLWLLFVLISGLKKRLTVAERLPVPVIVVGNITVGGAGKTPLTIALAQALRAAGYRPGIVSRGYGRTTRTVLPVSETATPAEVGDEPLLMARRTGLPVWVGRDRAAAGRALLAAHSEVDVLLCDDGLQHARLGRDIELAVFDRRGAGNGWRLPFGPLREPLSRLSRVDAVVFNGSASVAVPAGVPAFTMQLRPAAFQALGNPVQTCTAAALHGKPLHAVAGIGHPERFFQTLADLGLSVVPHPFPDHHAYTAGDLSFAMPQILLMTEKDAVKCAALSLGECWVLPVEADLPPALVELILEKLRGRQAA